MAKRRKRRATGRKSGRKTYKKKSAAKRAKPKGSSVYKVKGGYRISRKKRRRKKRYCRVTLKTSGK